MKRRLADAEWQVARPKLIVGGRLRLFRSRSQRSVSVASICSTEALRHSPPDSDPPAEKLQKNAGETPPASVLFSMNAEFTTAQTTPAVVQPLDWESALQARHEAEQINDGGESHPHEPEASSIIMTAQVGTNADMFPNILRLYVPEGSVVADVTFGKGVFWRNVDTSKYVLKPSDLMDGIDFRSLPYGDGTIDALVLDPPYMHDGKTVHKALNKNYRNNHQPTTSHASVIRLYCGGILEAARVLKKKGVIIVKCQDETESGKQRLSHVELIQLLALLGFEVIDLRVLVQEKQPIMRYCYQKSARKNHSYAVVARFNR